MEKLYLTGLKNVLEKFDEHNWKGRFTSGNWSIGNGGYDLWFELYYHNKPVVQCVAGEISSISDFSQIEKARIYNKILESFEHLKLATDAFVSKLIYEEALEAGWSEVVAKRGWDYFEDSDLPGILVIEKIDEMSVFEDDLEAGLFAKECGERFLIFRNVNIH